MQQQQDILNNTSVTETVVTLCSRDQGVTLQTIIETVIGDHVNGWSHEQCYQTISNCERVSVRDIGDSATIPQSIDAESDTDVERHIRYQAAVAVVEMVLDTEYDDPVRESALQLH